MLLDADFICDTVWVRWGRLPIRLYWVRDGGLAVSRPFFYFRLVWLACDDAGWRGVGVDWCETMCFGVRLGCVCA